MCRAQSESPSSYLVCPAIHGYAVSGPVHSKEAKVAFSKVVAAESAVPSASLDSPLSSNANILSAPLDLAKCESLQDLMSALGFLSGGRNSYLFNHLEVKVVRLPQKSVASGTGHNLTPEPETLVKISAELPLPGAP